MYSALRRMQSEENARTPGMALPTVDLTRAVRPSHGLWFGMPLAALAGFAFSCAVFIQRNDIAIVETQPLSVPASQARVADGGDATGTRQRLARTRMNLPVSLIGDNTLRTVEVMQP